MRGLSKWWRQFRARWKCRNVEFEWGGLLTKFNPQTYDIELLHMWEEQKDLEAAWEMVKSSLLSGRDEIMVSVVKVGPGRGYFIVHNHLHPWWERHFWSGLYSKEEAFRETLDHCIALSKRMGFSGPRGSDETKV